MTAILSKIWSQVPANWKGYVVAAAAGYASSQYGPAAGDFVARAGSCLVQ